MKRNPLAPSVIKPLVLSLGLLALTPAANAAFLMLNEGAYALPSDPLTVLTEARENARLKADLAQSQRDVAQLHTVTESMSTKLISREQLIASQEVRLKEATAQLKEQLDAIEDSMPKKVTVRFAFGSVVFRPSTEAAEQISRGAKVADRVVVNGFTDNRGSLAANAAIAFRRALSAKQYLVKEGVSEIKIRIYGRKAPNVASNDTAEGRAANRRVEMLFQRDKRDAQMLQAMSIQMLQHGIDAATVLSEQGRLPEQQAAAALAEPLVTPVGAATVADSVPLLASQANVPFTPTDW